MDPAEYEKMFRVEDTHWWFAGKRRLVRVLLDSLPMQPRRKVLDIGCGMGRHSFVLAERGIFVEGLELSPFHVERMRELNALHQILVVLARVQLAVKFEHRPDDPLRFRIFFQSGGDHRGEHQLIVGVALFRQRADRNDLADFQCAFDFRVRRGIVLELVGRLGRGPIGDFQRAVLV